MAVDTPLIRRELIGDKRESRFEMSYPLVCRGDASQERKLQQRCLHFERGWREWLTQCAQNRERCEHIILARGINLRDVIHR